MSFEPFFFFFVLVLLLLKGAELYVFPWTGNAGSWAVMLYVGEGPRESNGACSTVCRFSVTLSTTHNQIGTL